MLLFWHIASIQHFCRSMAGERPERMPGTADASIARRQAIPHLFSILHSQMSKEQIAEIHSREFNINMLARPLSPCALHTKGFFPSTTSYHSTHRIAICYTREQIWRPNRVLPFVALAQTLSAYSFAQFLIRITIAFFAIAQWCPTRPTRRHLILRLPLPWS